MYQDNKYNSDRRMIQSNSNQVYHTSPTNASPAANVYANLDNFISHKMNENVESGISNLPVTAYGYRTNSVLNTAKAFESHANINNGFNQDGNRNQTNSKYYQRKISIPNGQNKTNIYNSMYSPNGHTAPAATATTNPINSPNTKYNTNNVYNNYMMNSNSNINPTTPNKTNSANVVSTTTTNVNQQSNNYSSGNTNTSSSKNSNRASMAAYNLIPKSLLETSGNGSGDNNSLTSPVSANTPTIPTTTSNNNYSGRRPSLNQYSSGKGMNNNSSKRSSGHYNNNSNSGNSNHSHRRTASTSNNNMINSTRNSSNGYNYNNNTTNDKSKVKPKLGVLGVLSAKKSLNEFGNNNQSPITGNGSNNSYKRTSRVINQQSAEINALRVRIQELTADQEMMRKLVRLSQSSPRSGDSGRNSKRNSSENQNEQRTSPRNSLNNNENNMERELNLDLDDLDIDEINIDFNDSYLAPLLGKMSTYLAKFTAEYKEWTKANTTYLDSQHDRTETVVELAANLNTQLHSFIEELDDELDREAKANASMPIHNRSSQIEQTANAAIMAKFFNKKRSQIANIADTTSRLNSQLARVVLQLDDQRESPDFQKANMTNAIQSLHSILQQLNTAATGLNNHMKDNTDQLAALQGQQEGQLQLLNEKEQELVQLSNRIKELNELTVSHTQMIKELEQENDELKSMKTREVVVPSNKEETVAVVNKTSQVNEGLAEKYCQDLIQLNKYLACLTLSYDEKVHENQMITSAQNEQIEHLTQVSSTLNTNLANLTLLFDEELAQSKAKAASEEEQAQKLKKIAADLNTNLAVLSLHFNEKLRSKDEYIHNLNEEIDSLKKKWANTNNTLLRLTSYVDNEIMEKNIKIGHLQQDAVYFRDFTHRLNEQMNDYLGDFLQRVWDKNYENELLMRKNELLQDSIVRMNNTIAKFTLEIDSLRREKKELAKKLEEKIEIASDSNREEHYKRMAVDLNARVAKLTLEMIDAQVTQDRSLPVVKEVSEFSDIKEEHYRDTDKEEYYRDMAVNLNSRLSQLTLAYDEMMKMKPVTLESEKEELVDTDAMNRLMKQVVELNQNLSRVTLDADEEMQKLRTSIKNKDETILQLQEKLAFLNRNVIDLTFNTNSEIQNLKNIIEIKSMIQDRSIPSQSQDNSEDIEILYHQLIQITHELNKKNEDLEDQLRMTKSMANNTDDQSEGIINLYRQLIDISHSYSQRIAHLEEELEKMKNEGSVDSSDDVITLYHQLIEISHESAQKIKSLEEELAQANESSDGITTLYQQLIEITHQYNKEIEELKHELKLSMEMNKESSENIITLYRQLINITHDSNETIYLLKKTINEKEEEDKEMKAKLAKLNRQIVDITWHSDMERKSLQSQLKEKDLIISNLYEKLARLNRQVIDVTTNTNKVDSNNKNRINELDNIISKYLVNEENKSVLVREVSQQQQPEIESTQIHQLKLQMEQAEKKHQEEMSNYKMQLASKSAENEELKNEMSKMRQEMSNIVHLLTQTKEDINTIKSNSSSVSTDSTIPSLPEQFTNEIKSITSYLKETKACLENYENNTKDSIDYQNEIQSIAKYLEDTKNMALKLEE